MGLGYEGWIRVASPVGGEQYALGTGTAVPRARQRLESASGYGGQIDSPPAEIGIGLPHNYDWDQYDGSLSFEVEEDFYDYVIFEWLFDRQSPGTVKFASRHDALQEFDQSFWTSISISAAEGAAVEGSLGFYAIDRDTYSYGNNYWDNPSAVKEGNSDGSTTETVICTSGGIPAFDSDVNLHPIPYWATRIDAGGGPIEFVNWNLDFAQDVVRFFACEANTTVQEPKYLAVGPMVATFGGSYMLGSGFLGDDILSLSVYVGNKELQLKRLEATTESDDVQSADALVPLTVEYAAYEIGR